MLIHDVLHSHALQAVGVVLISQQEDINGIIFVNALGKIALTNVLQDRKIVLVCGNEEAAAQIVLDFPATFRICYFLTDPDLDLGGKGKKRDILRVFFMFQMNPGSGSF